MAVAVTFDYFLTVHRRRSTNYIFKTLPLVGKEIFTLVFVPEQPSRRATNLRVIFILVPTDTTRLVFSEDGRVIAVHASSTLVSSINISTQKTRLVRVLRFAVLNF